MSKSTNDQSECQFDDYRPFELISRFLILSAACGATLQADDLAIVGWMLFSAVNLAKSKKKEEKRS